MAKIAVVYGIRLVPSDELESFEDATIHLKGDRTASVTMHVIDGESEEGIRRQLNLSLDAFFEFYPEI